jgi:capsular polysaccharide biosynthesis protein
MLRGEDMKDNMYEQEIDLKDLMFAVFRKWQLIILVAIIFAVLLGGYKCVKELMNHRNEEYVSELKDQYGSDLEQYEQDKSRYEWNIEKLTASIAYQEKYRENSILMKADPYNEAMAAVDIYVKILELPQGNGITVTSVDPADGIVKAYASGIVQGTILKSVSKQTGIDLMYLKELVKVTTDYDANMINVSVTYTDEKGAEKILNGLLEHIASSCTEIQANLGQHTIAIMNQNIGTVVDQSLADYQKNKLNDLTEMKKNLDDAEKALKELEEPSQPVALSKRSMLREGMKYGVFGGFFGAFLVAFGVCIAFIMNGKLNTDGDLKSRFCLKFLGGFTEKREKRAFSGIDAWLDRLEGKEYISDEAIYDMLAANIGNLANKGTTILFTGTVGEGTLSNLVMKLRDRLPELQLDYAINMTKNASTLQRIPEFDEIILVETRKKSRYRDIEKEVEIVSNIKKEFMGYIVLASVVKTE